jgi:hypothetical protein
MAQQKDPALKLFEGAESDRKNWEALWQDVAELVLPRRDFTVQRSRGTERQNRIFDSTAQKSCGLLAAGLQQFLVNPQTKWFQLRVPGADEDREVKQWLADTRDKMLQVFNDPDANFFPSTHEAFLDVTAFGTMSMFIDDRDGNIRFMSRPLPEAYIQENERGKVDTYFRKYKLTNRQAAGRFGSEAVRQSKSLSRELDRMELHKEHEYVQAVLPNDTFDATKHKLNSNKPWASIHFLNEADKPKMQFSGFDTFPFVVSRWSKVTGETYGRSPAMEVLPDIRMLQEMSKTVIKSAQKVVDPPLAVPDDGFLHPVRMMPGGLNYIRTGQDPSQSFAPITSGGRVDIGQDMIEARQQVVAEAFFVNALVGILQRGSSSPLKATEVAARQQQSLRALSPVVSRFQNEFLGPLIDRVFALMLKNNMLPDPPASIQGSDLNVEFVSQAATAAQQTDADKVLAWLQQVIPMINVDPQAASNIDVDRAIRLLAELNNVPPEVLTDPETVQQARQQATQSEQQQQLATLLKEAGPGISALAESSETLASVSSRNNEQ